MNRITREKTTIKHMIKYYCRRHRHSDSGLLCHECERLLNYSLMRLDNCNFRDNKPICRSCTVHCFGPEMRERIAKVMRYSGPRMLFVHPVLALQHLQDVFTHRY